MSRAIGTWLAFKSDTLKILFKKVLPFHLVIRCSEQVGATIDRIKEQLSAASLVYLDETGISVATKLHWVHSASNAHYTYLSVEPKRGTEGMDAAGVLPDFSGIAIHDCWRTYFTYTNAQHGPCCTHLLRELTGIVESTEQNWAKEFRHLLVQMKTVKESYICQGKNAFFSLLSTTFF